MYVRLIKRSKVTKTLMMSIYKTHSLTRPIRIGRPFLILPTNCGRAPASNDLHFASSIYQCWAKAVSARNFLCSYISDVTCTLYLNLLLLTMRDAHSRCKNVNTISILQEQFSRSKQPRHGLLAVTYMRSGNAIKHLVRRIFSTRTLWQYIQYTRSTRLHFTLRLVGAVRKLQVL